MQHPCEPIDSQPDLPTGKPAGGPALIRGLDGLRAFSVLAVLLYHAHVRWLAGGFLGVEVFFVISGFLITGLLLKEAQATGGIDLRRFWNRRLRRLLPALLAFLFAVATLGAAFLGDRASQFRADLLASLAYLENWQQIRSGSSYFADQGLPLLRHLWSLAVEGQFYLVWPLVVAALLRFAKGRAWLLRWATALLALGAFGLMLVLADPANGSSVRAMESLNRVYLGSDTRALGLLVGALFALAPRPSSAAVGRFRWMLDWAAGAALVALALVMGLADFQSAFLYRGGFLLVDLFTVLVIAALVAPTRAMPAILGWRPLEWLGERSYGLYLWHWPVFLLLAHGHDGWGWFGLRLLVALVITELSFRFIETPLRKGDLKRWLPWDPREPSRWRPLTPKLAGLSLVAVAIWETVALANRAPYVDPVQESIRAGAAALDDHRPLASAPVAAPTGPRPPAPQPPPGQAPALPEITIPLELHGEHLTAVGDSVMKGAAVSLKKLGESYLGEGMVQIDAEECRSFASALEVLRTYRREERLGEVVVIHLGTNNSSIPEEQFRRLMAQLADRKLVLFLTAKSDKIQACETVNHSLDSLVAGFPNARLFDWRAAAEAHPDYFYSDQTHLRPEGAQFYSHLILAHLADLPGAAPGRPAPGVPRE
jgi:peptidoglycan/LPS O-acetylase OafA/YrhL